MDTNLTIVITNVGADFTRLGSFGDAEQFGGNIVAQMDRSYLNRSWNKPKSPVQVLTAFMPFATFITGVDAKPTESLLLLLSLSRPTIAHKVNVFMCVRLDHEAYQLAVYCVHHSHQKSVMVLLLSAAARACVLHLPRAMASFLTSASSGTVFVLHIHAHAA